MIRQKCPRCLAAFKFRISLEGKFVRCPTCNEKFQVVDSNRENDLNHSNQSVQSCETDLNESGVVQSRITICPSCQTRYKFKPERAGKIYHCKGCNSHFTMTESVDIKSEPTESPEKTQYSKHEAESLPSAKNNDSPPIKKARVLPRSQQNRQPELVANDDEVPFSFSKPVKTEGRRRPGQLPVSPLGTRPVRKYTGTKSNGLIVIVSIFGFAVLLGFILLILLIPAVNAARKSAKEAVARNESKVREAQARSVPISKPGTIPQQNQQFPNNNLKSPAQDSFAPAKQNELYRKYCQHMERTIAFYERMFVILQTVRDVKSAENTNSILEQLINDRSKDDSQWQTLPDLNHSDDLRFTNEFRDRFHRISLALLPELQRIEGNSEINDATVIDCSQTRKSLMELRTAFNLR
jgi:hypothetical protein